MPPFLGNPPPPPKKVARSFPATPLSKLRSCQAPFPLFENLHRRFNSPRGDAYYDDIVDQVQTFYRQDDTARFMPEKQDAVTIHDENGKPKEQKRILTMTVAEVYQLLKNEYPDVTIDKSKFSSLPQWKQN